MRRVSRMGAAAVVAVCLAVLTPPVDAAVSTLTVSGPGSGYVDIRLGSGNKFDLERATMRGGRGYLAIVFTRLGPPSVEDSALAVRMAAAETQARPRTVVLGHEQFGPDGTPLTAGLWRVYLLSDGPASVSVPGTRLRRDVSLEVTRRTSARLRVTDVETPLQPGEAGLYQGVGRHPFAMDGQSIVIMRIAAVFEKAPVTREGADVCDAERGKSCTGIGLTHTRVNQEAERVVQTGYVPRNLRPPGTYDVYGTCYSLRPVPQCRLAALDRWVRNTPAQVALTIPEPARAGGSPRPAASAPARGPAAAPPLATSGAPAAVAGAAVACGLAAAVVGRAARRRTR